jgi:hypothetical protein
MVVAIAEGWISFNLKTLSITDNSVDVVSMPQKEHQSFTTMPAAITSEPRLTVPACNTHYNTLTLCVASYPPHRYITHQLKPFTHQCHILWHMHCNYINILPFLTTNINFKILQWTFSSVNIGTCTHNTVKYTKINTPRSINTLMSGYVCMRAHARTHTHTHTHTRLLCLLLYLVYMHVSAVLSHLLCQGYQHLEAGYLGLKLQTQRPFPTPYT